MCRSSQVEAEEVILFIGLVSFRIGVVKVLINNLAIFEDDLVLLDVLVALEAEESTQVGGILLLWMKGGRRRLLVLHEFIRKVLGL